MESNFVKILIFSEFFKREIFTMEPCLEENFNKRNIEGFFIDVMPRSADYFKTVDSPIVFEYFKT